jgi:transposase
VDALSDENSQPQVNLVKLVRADGRRMYEWQAKLAIVREACAPGVSLAKVALKHGLNANLVRRWVVKHRAQATHLAAQSVPALLPVVVGRSKRQNATRAPDAIDQHRSAIEIELPRGVVRFYGSIERTVLQDLIEALSTR